MSRRRQASGARRRIGVIPPAGSPGPTSVSLLARANKVTPVGTFPTTWAEDSPTDNRTYDLRGGIFQGFFWADAIFGFGSYNGTPAPTGTHERNQFPVDIGDSNPAVGAAIIGGVVTGDQSTSLTWNSMKHGSHIQAALDSGSTGTQAWALIVNNQNQDGDPRIHITPDSFCVVDGLRTQHTHDGFGLYGGNDDSRSDYGIAYFRNCWFSEVHDDAIENDRQREISVYDCLFEKVHTFLSTRAPDTTGTPQLTKPQTITDSIIWLHPRPGPYQQPTSVVKHGNIYKEQANSPPLVMNGVIIGCSAFNSGSGSDLPTGGGCSYTNVTIVWTGAGAYPGNVPAGVTVTTDAAVLTDAVAVWKTRHGVTNFTTVDMVKMLAPVAGSPPPSTANLPGPIDGVEPEAHSHHPPMLDGNGNLYRITEEYAAPTANPNQPRMMKSSNGGETWAEVNAAGRPTTNDLESGWQLQSGTTIYYCWTEGAKMTFCAFATSDATVGADTWIVQREDFSTGMSAGSQQFASMARTSDGQFWFFYSDTLSGSLKQIAYARRTGTATYTAKTKIGTTADNFTGPVCVVGASDLTHIFYHDYANRTVQYRTMTTGGTLSSATRADSIGTSTTTRNYNAISNPVYYDASGVSVVAALFASASGLRLVSVVGAAVQSEQVVDSNAPLISPANDAGNTGNDGPVCSLAVNGTTLHAMWTDAATGDLYRSSRVHGGAWTTRTLVWASGTGHCSWVYNNVYTRGAQTVLGYTYDDGPHADNDSDIYYNEIAL